MWELFLVDSASVMLPGKVSLVMPCPEAATAWSFGGEPVAAVGSRSRVVVVVRAVSDNRSLFADIFRVVIS